MAKHQDKRTVVAIHVCNDDAEAEIVMSLLRDRGIECFPNSPLSHTVLPVAAGALGQVTIYVDEAATERAIAAIEESRGEN